MKHQRPVLIVRVHGAKSLATQAGSIPAHRQQFSREPHMVEHLLVAPVEAGPVEQQLVVRHKTVPGAARSTFSRWFGDFSLLRTLAYNA
jgi:hypothetical protein